MRIRALMALGLAPLFLVMGVAMAGVAEFSARRELARGVEEAAAAVARTTAEFVSARLREGRPYQEPLRRILGFGQVFALSVCGSNGMPTATVAAEGHPGFAGGIAVPREAVDRLAGGEVWVGPPEGPAGSPSVRAFAPMEDGGYVAAVVSVGSLTPHAARLRSPFIRATALFTLLGVAVALLTGSWLSTGVLALSRQARGVAAGEPMRAPPRKRLRELADLSLTFETMGSILEDSVSQARRALLTRSPTAALRAGVYHAPDVTDVSTCIAGHDVTSHVVGVAGAGLFAGAVQAGSGGCGFVGHAKGADDADRALEAAAAKVFLLGLLQAGNEPRACAREARCRFHLDGLHLATWRKGDSGSSLIHTLGPDADRMLDTLTGLFADAGPGSAGAAMAGAAADLGPGILMLIRPAPAGSAQAREVS